jgi:hypothetical protein
MTSASLYLPFRIAGLYSGLRLEGEDYNVQGNRFTNYNADFNTRINQLGLRSVGIDASTGSIRPSNREQVGQSAVSVIMFIDSNNNGIYDKGEKKVPAQGFRLTDFASYEEGRDTVLRIKQLQNYWTYNAVIVTSTLPDPSLVPEKLEFSFTTDPNRYKLIEVPLYRSGTAEGMVKFEKNGTSAGLGGVRLILSRSGDKKEEMIKTFSDGRFFAYQLLPGKYSVKPDSSQIQFLDAVSSPEKIEFEVKPTAEGDYIDNLNIELVIKMKTEENASHLSDSDSARAEKELTINAEKETRYDPDHSSDQKLNFQLQAGAFTRFSNAVEMCTRIEELTGVQATVLKYGRIYRVVLTDIPSNEVLISLSRILSINEIEFFQFRQNNEKTP